MFPGVHPRVLACLHDAGVERGIADEPVWPQMIEEFLFGDHAIVMGDEVRQDIEHLSTDSHEIPTKIPQLADKIVRFRANKAQNLVDVQAGERSFTSHTSDDVRVRLYGDAAVVTGQVVSSGTYKGQDFSGQFRYMKVFVKSAGQWRIVAWQATRMPQ
jgi:hypothetical protein